METIEKIITLLKNKKLSQKDLTDHLGLDKGVFTQWKNGSSKSYRKYIGEISGYLGVSADYLLNSENPRASVTDEEIKFALFNGAEDITDEMYDEVKQFAEMVKMREESKRKSQ